MFVGVYAFSRASVCQNVQMLPYVVVVDTLSAVADWWKRLIVWWRQRCKVTWNWSGSVTTGRVSAD